VALGNFPSYGLLSYDGEVHAWYGIGQSLVMLPADLFAGAITSVVGLQGPLRLKIEAGLVAYGTYPVITAGNVVLGYSLLRTLGGFDIRTSVLGILAWLFGTTVLPYSQLHYENSLDLCLALAITLSVYRWAELGDRKWLWVAGGVTLLDALTRVSNLADASVLTAGSLVAGYARVATKERRVWLRSRLRDLARVYVPCVLLSLVADRAYHVARFGWGEVFSTYIHLFGIQQRAMHPELPSGYPYTGSFFEGFFGPLTDANRSVFLFDPLAAGGLLLFVWAIATRRISNGLVAIIAAFGVVFFVRLLAYSTYAHWSGGTSWSNRFTLTPVQLALLFVTPVFLSLKEGLHHVLRGLFVAVLVSAISLQLCAVLVNPDLENVQGHCDRKALTLLPHRVANVGRILGDVDPEGLPRQGCVPEEFRRINILPWGNAYDLPELARESALAAWWLMFCLWLVTLGNLLARLPAARRVPHVEA
jgi:hypothetical protein